MCADTGLTACNNHGEVLPFTAARHIPVDLYDRSDFSGTAQDAFGERGAVPMERKFTVAINGLIEETSGIRRELRK